MKLSIVKYFFMLFLKHGSWGFLNFCTITQKWALVRLGHKLDGSSLVFFVQILVAMLILEFLALASSTIIFNRFFVLLLIHLYKFHTHFILILIYLIFRCGEWFGCRMVGITLCEVIDCQIFLYAFLRFIELLASSTIMFNITFKRMKLVFVCQILMPMPILLPQYLNGILLNVFFLKCVF